MTLPHSTQRTLPASCSSSVRQSEIRRVCVQVWGGLIGGFCEARRDSLGSRRTKQDGSTSDWSLIVWYPQCKTEIMEIMQVSMLIPRGRGCRVKRFQEGGGRDVVQHTILIR
jgi:hypothetical protein